METLKAPVGFVYQEKDSKFIVSAFPIQDFKQGKEKLSEIKKGNLKARHVLSLILAEEDKADEDKEPASSMHRLLTWAKGKGITCSAVYIVRYFGGTLLGASHLDRLYFQLGLKAFSDENLEKRVDLVRYEGEMRNQEYSRLEKFLGQTGGKIVSKDFKAGLVDVVFFSGEDKSAFLGWFISLQESQML